MQQQQPDHHVLRKLRAMPQSDPPTYQAEAAGGGEAAVLAGSGCSPPQQHELKAVIDSHSPDAVQAGTTAGGNTADVVADSHQLTAGQSGCGQEDPPAMQLGLTAPDNGNAVLLQHQTEAVHHLHPDPVPSNNNSTTDNDSGGSDALTSSGLQAGFEMGMEVLRSEAATLIEGTDMDHGDGQSEFILLQPPIAEPNDVPEQQQMPWQASTPVSQSEDVSDQVIAEGTDQATSSPSTTEPVLTQQASDDASAAQKAAENSSTPVQGQILAQKGRGPGGPVTDFGNIPPASGSSGPPYGQTCDPAHGLQLGPNNLCECLPGETDILRPLDDTARCGKECTSSFRAAFRCCSGCNDECCPQQRSRNLYQQAVSLSVHLQIQVAGLLPL